ncbi:uncharacterized protein LOC118647459 [Monomorium pharaonis]|uniref:uncharacterized protein LOC118647459 n=1 Tax=Monomorium pharaonis TaxID=307658 RepID=UPI0017467AF8|nr:uncharacterized protein LOC118647459 [Monomorium pharaonis]
MAESDTTNNSQNTAPSATNDHQIGRISIRPPQFSKEKPAIWFIQMKAQFATSGITQDLTKFYHAVQALDATVLHEVSDIVTNPPTDNKYETLKTRILTEFQDSEEKRLKTLLNQTELGDKRPSRLLKHMRDLAENKISEELLKSFWLQRLPTSTQTILSISQDPLDKLATMADRVHDIASPSISNLDLVPATSTATSLENQLCELIKRVDRIETRRRDASPRRYRRRSTSRPHIRSASPSAKICWYHQRFGREAKRCTTPCDWLDKTTNQKEN